LARLLTAKFAKAGQEREETIPNLTYRKATPYQISRIAMVVVLV
jgi:hypothetical protein